MYIQVNLFLRLKWIQYTKIMREIDIQIYESYGVSMQHKYNNCTYKATHNPNHRNLVKSVQETHVTSITNVYKVEHKYDMKTQILYINKAYTTTVINLKLIQ